MHTCVVVFMALKERKSSEQKIDYGPSWKEQYPWVVSIQQDDGTVAELLCELCSQLNGTKQHKLGVWTTAPCTSLHKDCIKHHTFHHAYGSCATAKEHASLLANPLESQRKTLMGHCNGELRKTLQSAPSMNPH